MTWLGLLALLTISAGSSYVDLGMGNTVINLGIAAAKIVLIATYFMHLRNASSIIRFVSIVALLFLFFMMFLSFGDFLTRNN